jgi:hypothetical protein
VANATIAKSRGSIAQILQMLRNKSGDLITTPFLGKSLEAKYHLDLPISTVNRSSDTNRVGPVSLAQWNGCDFVFSPLGSGNSQLSEPVDARLLPDAPLISLVC